MILYIRYSYKIQLFIFFYINLNIYYNFYDITFVNEDYDVKVLMTLTTPNCPVAETLPLEVEEKVNEVIS